MVDDAGLLASVRVLDLSGADGAAVTRIFADLGADVLMVEPPGGSPARTATPTLAGTSIAFTLHNANKRSVILDPADRTDRDRLAGLAAAADIVVDSGLPGRAVAYGTTCAALADRYPHLVALSVTDFGAAGPRSSWRATDPVLYALSGALSRSGPTTGTPVLPPDGIASATAAVQAAWSTLVAYYHRLRCGTGDYIDFSRFDAVVMALDPVFGAHGQAAAAVRSSTRWRGRPKNQDAYPIYRCADGHVRICVMAPRQWRGLRAWLGEPTQFQDRKFDVIAARFAAWPQISALIEDLFAAKTMSELVAAGQAHGVPIAAVLTPARALSSDHFATVGALVDTDLAGAGHTGIPAGYFVVGGRRAGFRTPAPAPGTGEPGWPARSQPTGSGASCTGDIVGYPFEGIRIVDLGIIVAGGEASRLFGDLGAEVIKVESTAYPDGLRQARAGDAMSESFAWTRRNNLGLGLDLRSNAGRRVFDLLVMQADAVFANFKPGTLAGLGISYDNLQSLNPRIVLAESSAFGETGPWSARMGYGPLVRATTGVTRLWTAPDPGPDTARHPFYDATTVFPDHVVGRITAIGALAALIHRDRTGVGARVHISQAEVAVNQLDTRYVTEAARAAGTGEIIADTSVHVVCPAAGDDEWCVISIGSDADWHRAARVVGCPVTDPRFANGAARVANRAELVNLLSAWTAARDPLQAATALQDAGVAAAGMNRPPDVADDPQLRERSLFADMTHPLFAAPLPAETGPAPFRHIPAALQHPAPLPGQHTREICSKILAMDSAETERLIADGVLFSAASPGEGGADAD